jgi:TorA maturation chaperone TorD
MLMSMGAQLAQMSSERPDHLSVMLDFLALLVCNGLFEEAQLYLCEHLEWLPRYKRDLLERAPFAWFYAVLLDVLIRLRASDAQQAFVRAVQQRQRQLYGQVASFG